MLKGAIVTNKLDGDPRRCIAPGPGYCKRRVVADARTGQCAADRNGRSNLSERLKGSDIAAAAGGQRQRTGPDCTGWQCSAERPPVSHLSGVPNWRMTIATRRGNVENSSAV